MWAGSCLPVDKIWQADKESQCDERQINRVLPLQVGVRSPPD